MPLCLTFYLFHQVGLKGEALSLHSLSGSPSVEWVEGSLVAQKQPLSWYKVHNSCLLTFLVIKSKSYPSIRK